MRLRALAVVLAALVVAAFPAVAHADVPTKYLLDDVGRLASVTSELGMTKYRYFDSGSIEEMVDPEGWRYFFKEGDAPASCATAAPNFLPSFAASVSNPLDLSANRFLFTAFMYERELGLYLTPSGRLYDPQTGRFIQQDSYLGTLSDPPSLHRYLYGNANPARYIDPSGHETATAGCYWGPSSCGPQKVPLTGLEKRGFAGLLGTLSWAGKTALETVNLALGRHWEGFGEKAVEVGAHPINAAAEAKEHFGQHVNAALDRAQERLDQGDDFGAAFGFTEEVTAPTAATVVGAGELAVGAVRTGSRLLARSAAAANIPPLPIPELRPAGVPVDAAGQTGKAFVVSEDGLVPAIRGGSQGADLLEQPRTIWAEEPKTRGNLAERRLAATEYKDWYHVGAEDKGRFPLIDFQKESNLVSLKTVDTSGKAWMTDMRSHIRDLATRGATVEGQPANMILDLRVPPGGQAAAESLVKFGEARGVTVRIKEIR